MADDIPSPEPDGDAEPVEDEPPDESTLLGKTGVEDEVLAELARAEAEMSGEAPEDESDARGAQV